VISTSVKKLFGVFSEGGNVDATYIIQLLIAPVAMLLAVGITSYNQRKEKQEEFERTKSHEREQRRIEACFDFLETFSKPIKMGSGPANVTAFNHEDKKWVFASPHRVDDLTPYLRAAMQLREFGDYLTGSLQYGFPNAKIQGESVQVQTLSDVIRYTMKLRYENKSDLLSEETLNEFEELRLIAVKKLVQDIILSIPWRQENTKTKHTKAEHCTIRKVIENWFASLKTWGKKAE